MTKTNFQIINNRKLQVVGNLENREMNSETLAAGVKIRFD